MRTMRMLLAAGVIAPLLYFAAVFLAGATYPGYSQVADIPSKLGRADAPIPALYNGGMMLTGLALFAGGLGLAAGIRKLGGSLLLPWITGAVLALAGIGVVMFGLFPEPHPLHRAFNLPLAAIIVPPLGNLDLWRVDGTVGAQALLVIAFLLILALLAIVLGIGGIATTATIGLWLRLLALVNFGAIALLCSTVRRRLPR